MGSVAHGEKIQVRNNAASLLWDLLNDEKNVGKVLIVKKAEPKVAELIKLIAATAAFQQGQLAQLATNDAELQLQQKNLPPGEEAARKATARTKEHELLFATGTAFEFNLLLTQAEAESYGSHLAAVAADTSTNAEEAKVFSKMADAMQRLHEQAVSQMRSLPPS